MPERYHPALVVLHWVLAVMIIGALIAGNVILEHLPNGAPEKLFSFRMHTTLGALILALMVVRLGVRWKTAHPPRLTSGLALFDALAPWVHRALYAATILMALSGIWLAVRSGLYAAIWAGGAMPPNFEGYAARTLHGGLSTLLVALILIHVAAALWHSLVRRDGLLRRMWFGRS